MGSGQARTHKKYKESKINEGMVKRNNNNNNPKIAECDVQNKKKKLKKRNQGTLKKINTPLHLYCLLHPAY